MKKILLASILSSSMMIFSGCGTTGDDNNTTASTCGGDLSMLSGDNPVITLEGDTEVEISLGTTTVLANDNFCAFDPQDGDLTQFVNRTNDIDFSRAGTYTVTYFVEDNDGNSDTKTRTVTIVDSNNVDVGQQEETYGEGDVYGLTGEYGTDLEGNVDLGEQVGGNTEYTGEYSGDTWAEGTGSSIDSFKQWYSSVCGNRFNSSLYNAGSGEYAGTISCSNRSLQTIDLRELSIFSSIQGLDLSGNQLTDIDFSQLGLNQLSNNTKILVSLNIKNNNLSTNDFDLFKPLFYLKNINEIHLGGNNFNYTCDDLYRLRTSVLNNKSLYIDREVEQNCPSLNN